MLGRSKSNGSLTWVSLLVAESSEDMLLDENVDTARLDSAGGALVRQAASTPLRLLKLRAADIVRPVMLCKGVSIGLLGFSWLSGGVMKGSSGRSWYTEVADLSDSAG